MLAPLSVSVPVPAKTSEPPVLPLALPRQPTAQSEMMALTGVPLCAHPLEQEYIDGTYRYRGVTRVCGMAQRIGRALMRYQPVKINEALVPGASLPFWGGLKVLHLPGHTEGHCGFYSQRFDLLFCGDLFASYSIGARLPPVFFNSCPEKLGGSLRTVQHLAPRHLIPNHADRLDGELHRRRFDDLLSKWGHLV